MALRKGSVDVIFPVADGWTVQGVKWALLALMSQTFKRWRLLVIDGTRSNEVLDLVSGIIPEAQYEYAATGLKSHGTVNDLLYEGSCGAKARFVTYLLPGTRWYPDHLAKLMHEMGEGADVVFMSRDAKLKRLPPERVGMIPGATKIQMVMHKLAHYERTRGFPRRSEADPAVALFSEFSRLRETAWEPLVASIPAREPPALVPETDLPFGPMKVTQLALFAYA